MNKIVAKEHNKKHGFNNMDIFIDGESLNDIIVKVIKDTRFEGLTPAWSKNLYDTSVQKYIWCLLDCDSGEELNVPIYLCSDDLDFSCITLVAKVSRQPGKVIWKSIGLVDWDNMDEDSQEYRHSGIKQFDTWTNKDKEEFEDRFNLKDLLDESWEVWINGNWYEECYRRIKNYGHKYLNDDKNIEWFEDIEPMEFDLKEYNICVKEFRSLFESAV